MNQNNSEQFILNLSSAHSYDADEYIVLPSNQSVVTQLLAAPAPSSPLTILFGVEKSGKTHLCHLWKQVFSAEFLPSKYLKVDEADFPEMAKIVNRSALIIDDIDKKDICEKSIFHLINLAIQANQPLLFTSSKPLLLWQVELPDLLSRLTAAKHIEINEPDDLLVEAILIKTFAEKQLNIPNNVIAYILPRMDRSVSAIVKFVDAVDEYALRENKTITRNLVAKMFENFIF